MTSKSTCTTYTKNVYAPIFCKLHIINWQKLGLIRFRQLLFPLLLRHFNYVVVVPLSLGGWKQKKVLCNRAISLKKFCVETQDVWDSTRNKTSTGNRSGRTQKRFSGKLQWAADPKKYNCCSLGGGEDFCLPHNVYIKFCDCFFFKTSKIMFFGDFQR